MYENRSPDPAVGAYDAREGVLVVQWFGVGLVIERSLVRLPGGALSSQLGHRYR